MGWLATAGVSVIYILKLSDTCTFENNGEKMIVLEVVGNGQTCSIQQMNTDGGLLIMPKELYEHSYNEQSEILED